MRFLISFALEGCFNFGQNVLLKRQRLKLQNIPIESTSKTQRTDCVGIEESVHGLKVEDMNVATLSYREHPLSWNETLTSMWRVRGATFKLAGTGSTDIHVINKISP